MRRWEFLQTGPRVWSRINASKVTLISITSPLGFLNWNEWPLCSGISNCTELTFFIENYELFAAKNSLHTWKWQIWKRSSWWGCRCISATPCQILERGSICIVYEYEYDWPQQCRSINQHHQLESNNQRSNDNQINQRSGQISMLTMQRQKHRHRPTLLFSMHRHPMLRNR